MVNRELRIKNPEWVRTMNEWGAARRPFLFVLDFLLREPLLFELPVEGAVYYRFGDKANMTPDFLPVEQPFFLMKPIDFSRYKNGYDKVQQHLRYGNSFLVNYTQPSKIDTNYSLEEVYVRAVAPYKLLLPGRFVVFSPEIFVRIDPDGHICSFPMKGTIDAATPDAEVVILADAKERAEHFTMVDLIRNDLSSVSASVYVSRVRYIDRVCTPKKTLLQVSSEIRGDVGADYHHRIGDILMKLLPAGSVTGAPKDKTVDIIMETEGYTRGYYTGVMGVFDGDSLDSAVMIRFLEQTEHGMVYKSGGGITAQSDVRQEYQELIDKVYVPVC